MFDRSQVVPWDHPDDFAIVSQARERACDRLAAWDLEEELFITELVVSELVIREVSAEPAYSTKAAVACSSSLS
ncbi:hypothetical protein SNL152K_10183 [Streptomyces sp. NL15-2K]|nr:hypothetical protein SNL152K_10183 [Streptomyces sp. NL15-2K]